MKEIQSKVQAGRERHGTSKRKRLPRIFIFLNIFVIFVAILHYYRSIPEKTHYGISLRHGDIHYQLTIDGDNKKKYLASLSVTNRSDKHLMERYRKPMAKVLISHRGTSCEEIIMGDEDGPVLFKPRESRAYAKKIDDAKIIEFIRDRPDSVESARNNILEKRKKYVPLTVELLILTPEPISTSTEIKYLLE